MSNDDRVTTEHTQGVWTTCDECGEDWWCVVTERDYLDEPTEWGCSGGCEDGWPDEEHDDGESTIRPAALSEGGE